MTTTSEAIVNYLTARRSEHPAPDLLDRYLERATDYETQVVVKPPSTFEQVESGWSDGLTTIWNIRIPKHSDSVPSWHDYHLRWPLDPYVDAIGSSGWDWVAGVSRYAGIDIDYILEHAAGVGVPAERIVEIREAVQVLPYVEIRTSTGGSGLHLYTHLANIPARNHVDHKATASRVLAKISHDIGFDLSTCVDQHGLILWLWRKNMATNGLKLIKAAEGALTEKELPVIAAAQARSLSAKHEAKAATWTSMANAYPRASLDDTHIAIMEAVHAAGYACIWDAGDHRAQVHTGGLQAIMHDPQIREELRLKGSFHTNSPCTERSKPNAWMVPAENGGWLVFRHGVNTQEHESWRHSADRATQTTFNVLPIVRYTPKLHSVVDKCIDALKHDINTYQRGGILVELHEEPKLPDHCLHEPSSPTFRPISEPQLKVKLSRCCRIEKWNGTMKEWVHTVAPKDLTNGILASLHYREIPVITGIFFSPVLRQDGTVMSTPGYDPRTGLYLKLDGRYPSLIQPGEAINRIDHILSDFPFGQPAHKSAWYAALITMLTRPAFPGGAPFFLVDGNVSRIGKGLLTDLLTVITEGHRATRAPAPNDGEAEMRKFITSIAISGQPYVLFDNLKSRFGGTSIENAITTGRWTDRILGRNEKVDISLPVTWLATSNNASLTTDMVGRTVHIKLETDLEQPGQRSDFKIPDLIGYVREHRHELAMAALSIPSSYIRAGRPKQRISGWGAFEGWNNLVRASLVWAGLADPDTRTALTEDVDEETQFLRSLIDAWEEVGEASVGHAFDKAHRGEAPKLKEMIDSLSGNAKNAIGQYLKRFRGRVVGGRRIAKTAHAHPKWFVENVTTCA